MTAGRPFTAPDDRPTPRRWVVVAESPFIPSDGGTEREHFGFLEAATAAGLVSAVVVPVDPDLKAVNRQDDLPAIERLISPARLIVVPRRRGLWRALTWRLPYVVASRPAPSDLVDKIRAAAPDADGVVVFAYKSHELGRVIAEGLGLPAIVRFHNLEGTYYRALADSASPPRSWAIRMEAARIDADERRLERSGWLRAIVDISASDATIRGSRSRVPVEHLPSFALGGLQGAGQPNREPSEIPSVVFLGSLDVATNQDSLAWFADRVWPRVRAKRPEARWLVVGRRPTTAVRELVHSLSGAELHADVPDPSVFLRQAHLAVNPAVSGSGVNIKLIDYLAAGVPVVSTQRGMSGLGLAAGRDLVVADEPETFASEVLSLLADHGAAERLGSTGRQTALSILDVETSLRRMGTLLAPSRG